MGRRGAVRREFCVSGQPREVALHRYHPRGEAAECGGVTSSRARIYSRTRVHRAVTSPVALAYLGTSGQPHRLRMAAPALDYRQIRYLRSPRGTLMSRSPFSRLSLCAAAFGALAITAFALAPAGAAEDAVIIPPPAADVPVSDGAQTVVVAG